MVAVLRRPTFQISDVRAALPGVSDQTIRIVLNQLKSDGRVGLDPDPDPAPDPVGRRATWTKQTRNATTRPLPAWR